MPLVLPAAARGPVPPHKAVPCPLGALTQGLAVQFSCALGRLNV